MSALDDKLIEINFFPHCDLFISWHNFIEESFSTERGKGHINIKYSEVPVFAYVLASRVGTDFLPEKILEEAKSKSFVNYAHEDYTELCYHINSQLEFKRKLWNFLGEEKTKYRILDEQLRYLKEKLPDCEYIGYISESAEYSSVDILHQDNSIYLAQRKDILRLGKELQQEVLKRTIEHYGVFISPVLRQLLEK